MSDTEQANHAPRLSGRVFYGVIIAGVLLGSLAAGWGASLYLEAGDREPTGRRIWGDVAKGFVVPVAVMMGSTFGGLVGFVAAAVWDRRTRDASAQSARQERAGIDRNHDRVRS